MRDALVQKLGTALLELDKDALMEAVRYGKQRRQFGRPIVEFGLIRQKIGEAAARIFVAQSMVYRSAGYIDQNITTLDRKDPEYYRKIVDVAIHEAVLAGLVEIL